MTEPRKLAQVPQLVAERPHRKQVADSAWTVRQCGQLQVPIGVESTR